jgi:hypothetical protein
MKTFYDTYQRRYLAGVVEQRNKSLDLWKYSGKFPWKGISFEISPVAQPLNNSSNIL